MVIEFKYNLFMSKFSENDNKNNLQKNKNLEQMSQNDFKNEGSKEDGTQFSSEISSSNNLLLSLIQLVQIQAKSIQSLIEKLDVASVKTNLLAQELKQINAMPPKESTEDEKSIDENEAGEIFQKINGQISSKEEILTGQRLSKILFGDQKTYNYKLTLVGLFEKTLVKERNFEIQIQLTDQKGNKIQNFNQISLNISIYTSENLPKCIDTDCSGNSILKGQRSQFIQKGQCKFIKNYFREGSSHYKNGWFFMVFIPTINSIQILQNEFAINPAEIEPLVLDKVIVKSHKIKDPANKSKK